MNLSHNVRSPRLAALLLASSLLYPSVLLMGCSEKKAAAPAPPAVEVVNVVQQGRPHHPGMGGLHRRPA